MQTADDQSLFFDDKTYGDLKNAAGFFSALFSGHSSPFIAVKMQSPYLCFAAQLGALKAGKTAVLLSPLETTDSIDQLRKQVPFEFIASDEHFDFSSPTHFEFVEYAEETPAVIVWSSGSSGTPKGIVLTWGNIFYSARGLIDYFSLSTTDVSLMNLPHHHVGGLMTLWRAFFSGSSLVSQNTKKFDVISVVPLQLARALEKSDELASFISCRIILVGGAKLTQELKERAIEKNLVLYETYGMSETASLVTINGEVLPYRDVQLDSEGSFLIGGKTLSPGYYREGHFMPLPLLSDGHFKTNDKGELKNGKYLFSHRSDLIFISGGENINPLSVEEVLRSFPGIDDAYVVPVLDEHWGEMGVALIDSESEISPLDLKNFLKSKIHPHHIPKKFFKTRLKFEGRLKPQRNELKKKARELFLKNLFSYTHIEKKDAPLIVFFHGFTGSKEDFFFLGKELTDHFSLLFIDLPGHGDTPSEAFSSTQEMLQRLSELIHFFSPTPILYGYSMGGRVALQLALHYLNVKLCLLESAGPGLGSREEAAERKSKDQKMYDSFKNAKEFLLHWYKNDLFSVYQKTLLCSEDIIKKSSHPLEQWKDSQRLLSQGCFPLAQENRNVPPETYYLYGSEDEKYKHYTSFYPKNFEIKGASHNPHKTHPAEITAIVKHILKHFT
jgi:O-succinylbenzoic acid--CoA ligase